jgi:DNA-binding Xre family transcriptional regulator
MMSTEAMQMISYEPFFRLLQERGITSYRLGKLGFPMTTYYAIMRGKHISTQTIDALCELLDCDVKDILEHKPNPKK